MKITKLICCLLLVTNACFANNDFLQSLQNTSPNNHKTLLIFYKPDCPYCSNMDKVITADTAFQKLLIGTYNVQVFDITSTEGRLMADKFNIHAVPAMMQYNNLTGQSQITKGFAGIQKLSQQLQIEMLPAEAHTAQRLASPNAACGDGIVNGGEACDDGNTLAGDGCNAVCSVEPGYVCNGSPSACAAVCGDGIVAGVESCDDGNNAAGDGCNAVCNVEPGFNCVGNPSVCSPANVCGDGVIQGTEICDDANLVSGDGCDANCTLTACGNGIVTAGEQCDDGNISNGDGCSNTCSLEPPANDNCSGASVISGVSGALNGNNLLATNSAVAAATCGTPTRDLWYSFTIAGTKNYRININGPGISDPIVALYSGTCGTLVQQACNDDIVAGNVFSQIQGTLAAGTYYVRVGSFGSSNGGNFSLVYNFNMPNVCGNSIIESTEECDDGNIATGDGCNNNCKIENAALITGVSVNNDSTRPNPSAMLEVKSYDKGLLIPRMNTTQRIAIVTPAKGLMVFDISSNTFWYYSGTAWAEIGGSSGGTGSGLPAGTASQTLRNNGSTWIANSALQNDGSNVTVTGQLKINGGSPAAGRVLTSDAAGTGSWAAPSYDSTRNTGFSVGNSFNQPFSTAFLPIINAESFDDGNNVSSGVFTAPAAGVYNFNANTSFAFNNITSLSTIQLVIESPASVFYGTQSQLFPAGFSGVADMQASTIIKLAAGAQVRLSINVYGTTGVQNLSRITLRGFRLY